MAQGRSISNLIEVSQNGMKEQGSSSSMVVDDNKVRVIGSRPPRCESRLCRNCGHCEAVQVPIVPATLVHHHHSSPIEAAIVNNVAFSSRGDALSNYKPMSWKCKCGDYFFNP
ncbi:hypothetical protein PIB30_022408 [Stylosanthes scabra]|uniref:Epidermal patterning factor-like protein n=1 Tax=Stylosanthes scabra TaxID=79078 RepID=A0ABU6Z9F7_9FABA|nr:hypothetical protein [Stylosanthes scabra]